MQILLALAAITMGQPGADVARLEGKYLKNIRQLTHDFARAGEGYFSPDQKQIIFQAEEKGDNPFYQIFTMDLENDKFRRVSPGVGKTTCAYFHPTENKVIFASSHLDPDAKKHYTVERDLRDQERKTKKRRRYVWDFDPHMAIFEADLHTLKLKKLTDAAGYNAEGSYSPDGKHIVFCSNRTGPKNLELFIMDADGSNVRQLTRAPGCYNGGPFFSPDGKRVIFRSDRKKKDHLQLYVINADGSGEMALTDDLDWVFWAPYWHKDGKHIVFTGADHSKPGRPNYDLWWMPVPPHEKPANRSGANDAKTTKTRLTYHSGADVLPVLSPDGRRLMWTSTRTPSHAAQLFIADFVMPKNE